MRYRAGIMISPTHEAGYRVERLGPLDRDKARALFSMMNQVFDEEHGELTDAYVDSLLSREQMWILAASNGSEIVGGLTAHVLPLTRVQVKEVFIYDLAVRIDHQRRGVGRLLMDALAHLAAGSGASELFVAADNEDQHALDFYRAIGGAGAPVTMFTFRVPGA
jgi:aminoglycoside 3-N-acetyltransferase I